jgi:hypothetical protein
VKGNPVFVAVQETNYEHLERWLELLGRAKLAPVQEPSMYRYGREGERNAERLREVPRTWETAAAADVFARRRGGKRELRHAAP